jgi:hypothetical protein
MAEGKREKINGEVFPPRRRGAEKRGSKISARIQIMNSTSGSNFLFGSEGSS